MNNDAQSNAMLVGSSTKKDADQQIIDIESVMIFDHS